MNLRKITMTLGALLWAAAPFAQASAQGATGSSSSTSSSTGPDVGGGKASGVQDAPYNEQKAEGRQPQAPVKEQGTTAQKLPNSVKDQLEKLHADNLAEVQVSQSAEQKAQSPRVKEFAQRMVQDHQKADQQLQSMASQQGVSLEGKAFQKEQKTMTDTANKLDAKNGSQFDTAYMKEMVKDHEKAVKDVRKQASAVRKSHPDLAQFFTTLDGKLQQHLDLARRTERSLTNQARRSSSTSGG